MKVKDSFGNWLRQRRKALDLTQFELSDQVGCSVVTIRKIEADERRPSKQITERLAEVLAISQDERTEFVAFARHTEVSPSELPLHSRVTPTATHNLPPQPTPFIGRADELAQIAERFDDPACRLLTLVGAGGIGKTRLALQAAADQIPNFANGVYFVALTGVGSPNLVASAIAGALEVSFYGPEAPDAQLVHYLRRKALLLVLDNFEHLLEETGLLTDILAAASAVKILATSRERLSLQEEWVIALDGLLFPQEGAIDQIESYSAVQLFAQRAQQVQANFSISQNAEAVLSICRYVEGMPLGLELAASWLRVISCQQVAAQIEHSLDILTTPLRNVSERHRNLRVVFEQSWGLLSEVERSVLAALSVFRGGFDLEAAGQVVGASLSVLARLADKSLIRVNSPGRYDLHELLRQFAADKLVESGATSEFSRRHLAYFSRLADEAEAHLYGPQQETWLDRLEMEHGNLNAAFAWSLSDAKIEMGLRLASALGFFWEFRAHFYEGYTWLERLLAIASDAPTLVRAKALQFAGVMACNLGDDRHARIFCEESLALAYETNNKRRIAWSLSALGWYVEMTNDLSRAIWLLKESLALFRDIGDRWGMSHVLRRLGWRMTNHGDYEQARVLLDEALMLARAVADRNATAWSLCFLGNAVWLQDNETRKVIPLYEESLSLARDIRDKNLLASVLFMMGELMRTQTDYQRAQTYYEESLALWGEFQGRSTFIAQVLAGFGGLTQAQGKSEQAARLFSASNVFLQDQVLFPLKRADFDHDVAAVRVQLGEVAFAAAWAEGQAMTLEQAIACALGK